MVLTTFVLFGFRTYIQTEGADIQHSILEETLAMFENMETLTLKLLMEIIADDAEV